MLQFRYDSNQNPIYGVPSIVENAIRVQQCIEMTISQRL